MEAIWDWKKRIRTLESRVDAFYLGTQVALPGGIFLFSSIPQLIADTRGNLGLTVCVGGWIEYDGNISYWMNLGQSIQLTPRVPNGQTIIVTAGGLWMHRVAFEEYTGVDIVITPPAGMPFESSYPLNYDTIAAAKLATGQSQYNFVADQTPLDRFVKTVSPAGTEDVDYYQNAAGVYYQRVV